MIVDSVATVKDLIEAVGFPIVCCIALFWYINTNMREQRRLLDEISKTLVQVVDSIRGMK